MSKCTGAKFQNSQIFLCLKRPRFQWSKAGNLARGQKTSVQPEEAGLFLFT
jgi:hypothetical protein